MGRPGVIPKRVSIFSPALHLAKILEVELASKVAIQPAPVAEITQCAWSGLARGSPGYIAIGAGSPFAAWR